MSNVNCTTHPRPPTWSIVQWDQHAAVAAIAIANLFSWPGHPVGQCLVFFFLKLKRSSGKVDSLKINLVEKLKVHGKFGVN